MKINIKSILFLPILFLFIPSFVVWIPGLNTIFYIFYLTIYFALIIQILVHPKEFYKKIRNYIYKTPFKIFCLALILMIVNALFLSIIGVTTFSVSIKNIFFQIFLRIIPLCAYFLYIIDKYISYKDFVRTFLLLFWLYMLLGIIIFISQLFNFMLIPNIADFLSNARYIRAVNTGSFDMFPDVSNYYAFGLPRIDNLHEEPSLYARFIYVILPLIYSFSLSPIKLVKSKVLNLIVKKSYIPLTILNIILSMSPIFLILTLVISFIYFFKNIILFIKKYFVLFLSILISICIFMSNINFANTYISRIVNVITQVKSFNDFILVEESLAIRIINYANILCIFLKKPFTGVGFGNIKSYMLEQYNHSPLPLTPRIESRIQLATSNNTPILSDSSLIYMLLAENGIFIFTIYIYFFIILYNSISRLLKLFANNKNGFYYVNLRGIKYSLIGIFIIFFYDSSLLTTEFYIVYIMSLILIYKYKREEIC